MRFRSPRAIDLCSGHPADQGSSLPARAPAGEERTSPAFPSCHGSALKSEKLAVTVGERFRRRVTQLIEAERKVVGCMDLAMKRVAAKFGKSPAWLHRIRGRYGSAKVEAHHYVVALMLTLKPRNRRA
jgi:hypothetical protein